MKGFRDFLMRGNLVELAVAVIIGTAFAAVVKAFTGMIMDIIGKFGGVPDFSSTSIYGISVGVFITALLSFILTAAVVYWLVVLPYNRISERLKAMQDQPEAAPAVTSEDLLTEIRDLLRQQAAGNPVPGQVPDHR
ncbi:large conductance mechanosensitive channel protein MscL [Microlunatus flavus]|uniref:Large conductance mechanosensitive channel n=1 Tax=Microlunatus flavus TaxID=1036181 RepID=A0A1H9JZ96_9ACTN|nr:large conductance mechanosensitive channel protein MscL [Microlunatus flavus]SEQ92140.1 large conductance mechanosensitive channel [Microlunatus flavus]